jgi:hypothetical protein
VPGAQEKSNRRIILFLDKIQIQISHPAGNHHTETYELSPFQENHGHPVLGGERFCSFVQNRSTRCKVDRATNSNRKQLWLTRHNRKKLNQPRKASKAAVAMEGERGGEELTAMAAFPAQCDETRRGIRLGRGCLVVCGSNGCRPAGRGRGWMDLCGCLCVRSDDWPLLPLGY